ncbi:GNAT family N-acetyltransferase [Spirosoma rhododendri]|uniref:GNAT family N-acetyltransferase n=1 Tax=Spirosoma rhododendri TaxID=2728024 RepID=A0A7L5DN36_9BACT|nr:GNAT family N-acetyltransferase [Spirosoma rhododendri]QJD77467.1 GNAT family N-acetyltransferase [Spirosoma rhododendri]
MPEYTILDQVDQISPALPTFSEPGFFFNSPAHLNQQGGTVHQIVVINQETGQADGRCAFFLRDQQAVSPLAAPFGSVEFAPDLPDDVLSLLINSLIKAARTAGATSLRLVNYPDCYAPTQARRLARQLVEHGFEPVATYENLHLTVTSQPFGSGIDSMKQRRLRKCRTAGFRFAHWQSPDLCAATAFVGQIRQLRCHAQTIEPASLRQLLLSFPDQFPLFGVWDADRLIALAAAVRVSPDILYYFLPVSDPAYDAYSPMVLLIDGLWQYCQQQQISLLDLGVSLNGDRTPKPSLIQFKRNLGGQSSAKTVYERAL